MNQTGGVSLVQTNRSTEENFLLYIREMTHLQEVLNLLFWDTRTGAPKNGLELRAEAVGTISAKKFAMSISTEMKAFIDELTQCNNFQELSPITRKALEHAKKEYELHTKIPMEEYKEYVIVRENASKAWEVAKKESDYSIFQPHLEKLVTYNKRFITYWGYQGNPYNALLDLQNPGMTVDILDRVFATLKKKLISLLNRVKEAKGKPTTTFLFERFSIAKQRDLNRYLLKELGYDFDRGRLDETVHPFAMELNRNDVRITTRYDEFDFKSGLFGTIHEFGHALYELNISDELIGTPLCNGTSAGIHESQSLFWEKMIGLNKNFWKRFYPALKQYNPDQFNGVEIDEFYRAINSVQPSFIRVEADELTYPLHVILRYEIEKGLFNNEIELSDLPDLWNQKMEEYLGITPDNHEKGVLQDMHWSAGMFGLFPSYALGYLYAAQFRSVMLKDLIEFDHFVENANFIPIREWLAQTIHVHGKMKEPNDLLLEVTGEELNPDHLIAYLEQKYGEIYNLESES
ncbi:carboxypeptidase M32 [Brevibacillus fluminis]|uniref:Metal-dependent carboxypeptidase n=1 Tax=Brevibacillus fluminis TaxID=511487 RepID=A0A3M8D9Y2_9BACL|nr:carboxypeptidase M32 [Brevibacillus fluminis]